MTFWFGIRTEGTTAMRRTILANLILLAVALVLAGLVVRSPAGARWLVVCVTLGIGFGVARALRRRR